LRTTVREVFWLALLAATVAGRESVARTNHTPYQLSLALSLFVRHTRNVVRERQCRRDTCCCCCRSLSPSGPRCGRRCCRGARELRRALNLAQEVHGCTLLDGEDVFGRRAPDQVELLLVDDAVGLRGRGGEKRESERERGRGRT
jgi:hypothetical protein